MGIRKILGASFKDLVLIFLKDFNLPSLLAVAAAIPLGYYFLNKWLDEFAYKTALPLWIYIVIVIISFTIAWATIGIHIYSASRTNPVDNLRYE